MFPLCPMWENNRIFPLSPSYTVQNPLWNKQVCTKLINIIIENNLSHRYGVKSTLCYVAIKVYPLSSHIFIWTCHFCFAVTWCTSAASIYLSMSYNDPGIKSETYGVILHIYLWSKIQLVNLELSPKYLLGLLSLLDIHAIDAYIFWSS